MRAGEKHNRQIQTTGLMPVVSCTIIGQWMGTTKTLWSHPCPKVSVPCCSESVVWWNTIRPQRVRFTCIFLSWSMRLKWWLWRYINMPNRHHKPWAAWFPLCSCCAVRCAVPTGITAELQPADGGGGPDDSLSVRMQHRFIGFCVPLWTEHHSALRRWRNHLGRRKHDVCWGCISSSWWFGSWSWGRCLPLRADGIWYPLPEISACATVSTFV